MSTFMDALKGIAGRVPETQVAMIIGTDGIPVDKLNLVVVWREAPQFSKRERAALAWTEALTQLGSGVSGEIYAEASAEFSEKELAYLTSAVAVINVWNRYGVAYRWTRRRGRSLRARRPPEPR